MLDFPLSKQRSRRIAPKQGRIRSPRHMAWVASLPCSVPHCARQPIQVHHLLCSPEPKARGLKAGDNWTLPICVWHHTALHQAGDERQFWDGYRVDPIAQASHLWAFTGIDL